MANELNDTQKEKLSLLDGHIDGLQKFVHERLKAGPMTAAKILEIYSHENNVDFLSDEHVDGFRIATQNSVVTGLKKAGRMGYKLEGSQNTPLAIKNIEKHLDDIQKFVDDRIQGSVKMTCDAIFEAYKKENGWPLSEKAFTQGFRLAVKIGKITGLKGIKRFGYCRVPDNKIDYNDNELIPQDAPRVGAIIIDDNRRLVASDLNWNYQVRKGNAWSTEAYLTNAYSVALTVVRKLMDEELRNMPTFNINEFPSVVAKAEDRLTLLLQKAMNPEKKLPDESRKFFLNNNKSYRKNVSNG